MKRVLSLVLALVMVFGTIMPAFAESTDSQAGQDLESYGIIAGNGTGLNESGTLTRAEMTVILAKLNGKATEAAAYAFESAFTDDADAWYTPWVAYAATQGWMSGYPDGTFKPSNVISAQEVNVLMVKALGYDVEWATANTTAADLGVAVTAKDAAKVLRGEIFTTLRAALDVNAKDATDTLGTALALTGYVSPTPATPETLAVSKVMTDNRKTVVVEFNQELFKKSVTTTNFKVTGLTVSKTLLSEDMKTVTMVMSAEIDQSKEIEVEIKKVKSADEKLTIADYKEKFVVNDVTIPVVESITVVDAKHIKIQASEPMDFAYAAYTVLPGVKIDGNAVIGKVVADHQNFTYTIELNSVKKEGSYKMVIDGLKDYSKLAAVKKEFSFDVVKDDTAPVALSAKAASVTVVEVTFDEPLTTAGTITVNGKDTTVTFKADSSNKIVLATLKAEDKLTLGATVEVLVKYKGQKDVVGNEVKTETTLTFQVTDDVTMPTVALEVKTGNKMVLTFSKAMDTTLGKVIVLNKDKKVKKEVAVSGLGTWNTDKTVLTIVASSLDSSGLSVSNTDPAEAYLQLKGMKDSTVRANLLATIDLSASLLDTKKPEVASKYVLTTGSKTGTDEGKDDTITFFFTEAMDEDSIKNLSNYLVNGASLATLSHASVKSVATDKKSIEITYLYARNLTATFSVIAVKDMADNMAANNFNVTKTDPSVALNSYAVEAKSATQIIVTFPVKIKSIDPAALAIYKSDGTAYTTVSSVASIDGATVKLNLVKALDTDTDLFRVRVMSATLVKNVYDAGFTGANNNGNYYEIAVTDSVVPVMKSMQDGNWDNGATPDPAIVVGKNKASILMSEAVDFTLAKADFVVKLNDKILADGDYGMVLNADNKHIDVTINSNDKVTVDGKYSLSVQLVRESTLNDDNTAALKTAPTTVTITDLDYDYTAPAVTLAAPNTSVDNSVVITFTDDVDFRAAVTAITHNGNAVTGVWGVGTLTLDPAHADNTELRTADTQNIVVVATGYADSTVALTMTVGAVTAAQSTAAVTVGALDADTINASTVTVTARDKYTNVVDGYVFKVDGTKTDAVGGTNGVYTVDAQAVNVTGHSLTATAGGGLETFVIDVTTADTDGTDGITVKVFMNDGTTQVGTDFADLD